MTEIIEAEEKRKENSILRREQSGCKYMGHIPSKTIENHGAIRKETTVLNKTKNIYSVTFHSHF